MASSMTGKILRIDCSAKTAECWEVPADLEDYIGGIGYGTKILIDEVDPSADPISPENKLILSVGPLTGTSAPMHPQACIVTKSPLSRTILNSYAGGFLGAEIKFCGIDGIILEGASEEWLILLIDDDKVRFESARPVMGKPTQETEEYIKDVYGRDYRTLSIGEAGEKDVAMAAVFSETRTFGRGGAGAVLGSKRIKGIGFRGTKPVGVYDPDGFREAVSGNMKTIRAACGEEYNLVSLFARYGTGAGMSLVQSRGALATKNHTFGSFEHADRIDGQFYEKNFYTRWIACFGCPVHCGRLHKFRSIEGKELWGRGPEYETMFSFGSDLMVDDPNLLAELNRLTELYGIDSLTTGVTIAWALEMSERGALQDKELPMRFGDGETILGLVHRIGRREGIGDLLARGPKEAALAVGGEGINYAMQVKNSGFAAWMPRRMKGTGLAFATSNRGACHKRAPIGAEIIGAVDMDAYEGKAAMVIDIQNTVNAIFTLISCRFHEFITDHDTYPQFLRAATGRDMDWDEMKHLGERIWNLEKLFNLKAGLTREDDMLPEKCFHPIEGVPSEGAVIVREEFEKMLDEYYRLRGWNAKGVPEKQKLAELGIASYSVL